MKKANRFRKPAIALIGGFELAQYDSLLARERWKLLETRKEIFGGLQGLVSLAEDVAARLEVNSEIAWHILQNNGIAPDGSNYKSEIVPFLLRMAKLRDSDEQNRNYMMQSVAVCFASRLSPDWLRGARDELTEAFGLQITDDQLDHFGATQPNDRLDDSGCMALAEAIARSMPTDIFEEILDFVAREENGGQDPEETADAEEEEDTDPKAQGRD